MGPGQDTASTFRFVEVFAGQAEATRMFRFAQLPAARLDIDYMEAEYARQNPMDLLSDAGMVRLGIGSTKFSLIFCYIPGVHFPSFRGILINKIHKQIL